MNNLPYYIVGSGPSSISAAVALLKHDLQVVMVDAAKDICSSKSKILKQISNNSNLAFDVNLLEKLYSWSPDINNVFFHAKKSYGDTFFYEQNQFRDLFDRSISLTSSLAKGGLSNVWGASVLPYDASDIYDWPITIEDLNHHYLAVANFMPLASSDELPCDFYSSIQKFHADKLNSSPQVTSLINNLNFNKHTLNSNGIKFGNSILALQNSKALNSECIYCGNCLEGCPKQLIYNSKHTLDILMQNRNFTYIPDTKVLKFSETAKKVSLNCINTKNNQLFSLDCNKVYIGCGVINTAKIFVNSHNLFNVELSVKDSQYYHFPLFQKINLISGANNFHALCQLFLKVSILEGDSRTHLQLYPINKTFRDIIFRKYPFLLYFPNKFLYMIFNRTLLTQAYLPSNFSSTIKIKFNDDSQSFMVNSNPRSNAAIDSLVNRLNDHSRIMGIYPLFKKMISIEPPGSGHHFGSTFPMSNNSFGLSSDILGRAFGSKRVHCIDASIFPSIPSGPITFSVMANAHRIASSFMC